MGKGRAAAFGRRWAIDFVRRPKPKSSRDLLRLAKRKYPLYAHLIDSGEITLEMIINAENTNEYGQLERAISNERGPLSGNAPECV